MRKRSRSSIQTGSCLAAFVILTIASVPLGAQSGVRAEPRRITFGGAEKKRQDEAIRGALDFFRLRQSSSGGEYRGFLRERSFPVAATSLAGLAMLACGVQAHEGRDADLLNGCLNYLLDLARRSPFITEPGSNANSGSRMHGHCYAVLFLTQIAGSLPADREEQVSRAIRAGIKVIERAQSREGGWYYMDKNPDDRDEASVTICAIQALRAARNAGYTVDASCIDRAIRYVKRCQNPDGGVRYELAGSRDRVTYTLTAAAVSTLNAAGVYRSEELSRGLDFMKRELAEYAGNPLGAVVETYFFYGNFYAAQALWQQGGTSWKSWYGKARERLLRKQSKNGNWKSDTGDVYATAMALLILQMPVGYLPIFER